MTPCVQIARCNIEFVFSSHAEMSFIISSKLKAEKMAKRMNSMRDFYHLCDFNLSESMHFCQSHLKTKFHQRISDIFNEDQKNTFLTHQTLFFLCSHFEILAKSI